MKELRPAAPNNFAVGSINEPVILARVASTTRKSSLRLSDRFPGSSCTGGVFHSNKVCPTLRHEKSFSRSPFIAGHTLAILVFL